MDAWFQGGLLHGAAVCDERDGNWRYVGSSVAFAGPSVTAEIVTGAARGWKTVKELWAAGQQYPARDRQDAERVQRLSEERAVQLMVEFSSLDDADIATLMRDELVNMRC